ncbi:hypothetical protein [Algoriphagus sp.]|uniref:hypothetical protein n=1 Tax=Algoriphagus sp. TaxID=1872435 RepID=UPI00391A7244
MFFTFPLIGLIQIDFWAEFDGVYWQKYQGLKAYGVENIIRNGSLRPFVGIGVKSNFLEFRKQILSSYPIPEKWFSNFSMNYGNRYDFGSAVAREGIRV